MQLVPYGHFLDNRLKPLFLLLLFISFHSLFAQFGHLVEFFICYTIMLVATAILAFAKLYPLWGLLAVSFLAFFLYLRCWTLPQLAGLDVLLFLLCILSHNCYFLDRWYSHVPPYVLISNVPWGAKPLAGLQRLVTTLNIALSLFLAFPALCFSLPAR